MPAPILASASPGLQKLAVKLAHYEGIFQKTYPEFYAQIQTTNSEQQELPDDQPHSQPTPDSALQQQFLQPLSKPLEQKMASQITQEEYASVIDKARAITQLPPGQMEIETALYLEQQLGDLLGFQIATKLQNQELLHTHGTIRALPHLKRTPTDTAQAHELSKAPFSNRRGYFGWLHQHTAAQSDSELFEKYYVALPFYLLPNWTEQAASLKKWYAFRKVVVINPHRLQAVVCSVADSFEFGYAKYQFGASPEVIMEGQCWSPETLGKVLLFFVADENNQVPLGPTSLALIPTNNSATTGERT